jgi:superfamily II DNA or RNA helicase
MSRSANLKYFRDKGLMPFQAKFALSFLESDDENCWELVSPVGTGKTRVGAALAVHELEEDLNKRILVLAPSSLLEHWKHEISSCLSTTETSYIPLIVDRKTYLELESMVPVGGSAWPIPAVILMSIDLAKREDMASNLCSVTWDLVIFDESHHLTKGQRKELFDRFKKTGASSRTLLLTAINYRLLEGAIRRVNIGFSDAINWDGDPLYPSFERKLSEVYYQRSAEEINFLNELQGFTKRLVGEWMYGKFQETIILRTASSSIYTTGGMLHRLHDVWKPMRNKIAHHVPWTKEDLEEVQRKLSKVADEPGVVDELPEDITLKPAEFLTLYHKLESLLNQIEDILTDSKVETLISYVQEFFKSRDRTHLCIWCSFANTVQYLSSILQELGQRVWSITGALKAVELMDSIESFRQEGGILITTDVASEGVTLEYVDECINYDLPVTQQVFEQRYGRFLRLGRKSDFRMVFLIDQSKALVWEGEVLKTLEYIVSSEEHARE